MPSMSLFGGFIREGVQLLTKCSDPQLKNGDHILVEFGREKTPVYIFYHEIPVHAKLLVDLNKLPPLKRRITLPTVAKFMWDNYLDYMKNEYDVVKAAETYSWSRLFLLAHTTKILQDDRTHAMSLGALLEKGESVNYQTEGMFTMSDWQLVRNTVKAGVAQDDRTRDTIRKLFHECPLLYDHMMVEHGATEQELHEIGLEYADTYEAKYTINEDGLSVLVRSSVYGRPPRPIIHPPHDSNSEVPDEDLPDLEDDWVVASIASPESNDNDPEEEDPVNDDLTTANVPSHPTENLADQLANLAVEEVTTIEDEEDQILARKENPVNNEGAVVLPHENSPVSLEEVENSVGSPGCTDVPQETSSSQGPSAETEMLAALAQIPVLQESKWASERHHKLPVDVDADTKAALTDFVNDPTDLEQGAHSDVGDEGDHDVIVSHAVQSEEGFAQSREQQQTSSEHQLPEITSASQSDAEDFQEVDEDSDEECTSYAENAYKAEPLSDSLRLAEYTAGFVPTRELPRTAPGTPAESEMGTADSQACSDADALESKPRSKKRSAPEDDTQDRVVKQARHEGKLTSTRRKINEPARKYGNSVLHMLREKQAASELEAVRREEPVRQPKGPPASGKEMAKENFAGGAPTRKRKR